MLAVELEFCVGLMFRVELVLLVEFGPNVVVLEVALGDI
jgi:hypothetical protein